MRRRTQHGFSIVELMVAMFIMTVVMAAVFALVSSSRGLFAQQPELQDLQQRLRVAAEILQRDLLGAGAGTWIPAMRGPLTQVTAPILPYAFSSKTTNDRTPKANVISLTSVLNHRAQAVVRAVRSGGASIQVAANCGSRAHDRICGFTLGMSVILSDSLGHTSFGVVDGIDGEFVLVDTDGLGGTVDAASGAVLAGIERHQYWLEPARGSDPPRLMHFDGEHTSAPVVDHLVFLRFDYVGDPRPPMLRPPAGDQSSRRRNTTYGPRPPLIGHDDEQDEWGPGENCAFAVVGGEQVSRLPALAASNDLVTLTLAELADGPWCPNANHPYRFDADLLRIRRVAVTIRVEAADAGMRGPTGPLFTRGGVAVRGYLPDQELRFEVTPRNLNLALAGS